MGRPPPSTGRSKGSRNKKTLERRTAKLYEEWMLLLIRRSSTDTNKKRLNRAVDELHKKAAFGDIPSLRFLHDLKKDLNTHEARRFVAEATGMLKADLAEITSRDLVNWLIDVLPEFTHAPEGIRDLLEFVQRLARTLTEQEQIELMRSNLVTLGQVRDVVRLISDAANNAFGLPEHAASRKAFLEIVGTGLREMFPQQIMEE